MAPRETADGERCQRCGQCYTIVYHVPDDLWVRVTGRTDGGGLFCLPCVAQLACAKSLLVYWTGSLTPFAQPSPCDTCDGSGWFWVVPYGWAACATCNDAEATPKPVTPAMTLEDMN